MNGNQPENVITSGDIDRLVTNFYSRVRNNPDLSPIFNKTIGTDSQAWSEHEAKIAQFWRKTFKLDSDYSGNPFLVHQNVSGIEPGHFAIWLELFEESAYATIGSKKGSIITSMAHRISKSLLIGIESNRKTSRESP
ncbi:MAG: group III truncated hemoglobin [Parvularculales bacterium]